MILGALYAIIKYTALDPGQLYRVVASVFGCLCLSEVLQPLIALSPAAKPLVGVSDAVDNFIDSLFPPEDEDADEKGSATPSQFQAVGESPLDKVASNLGTDVGNG